jgi:hypothetical protein
VEGKKGSCVCMTMLFFMQIYDFSCLRYIPKLILEKQVVDKLHVRSSEAIIGAILLITIFRLSIYTLLGEEVRQEL